MTTESEPTKRQPSAATLATRAFAKVQQAKHAIEKNIDAWHRAKERQLAREAGLKAKLTAAEAELEKLSL